MTARERPTASTVRKCPYCGEKVRLVECAIVATDSTFSPPKAQTESRFNDEGDPIRHSPTKPSAVTSALGKQYRLLIPGAKHSEQSIGGRIFGSVSPLSPVTQIAAPASLPRRACTECNTPFPLEFDDYDAVTLAVVGINRAGKSYLLGMSLTTALREGGLLEFGFTRFEALDETARRVHQEYYKAIFRTRKIETTQKGEHTGKEPLVFFVEHEDGDAFILVTHDVAGENLMDRELRAATAGFVSTSDLMMLIADPEDMPAVRAALGMDMESEEAVRSLDQGSLFQTVVRESKMHRGATVVPLAIVMTKCDKLDKLEFNPSVIDRDDPASWQERVRSSDTFVSDFLEGAEEHAILSVARGNPATSMHAVSVGRFDAPGSPTAITDVAPIRVLDPLGTLLDQIVRLRKRRA